jgi:hypothetical protein
VRSECIGSEAEARSNADASTREKVTVLSCIAEATRQGLLARGWVENVDGSSPFFDLKWSVRAVDIDMQTLLPGQIVNHFHMSERFTTKVGLLQCMRDMKWSADVDPHFVFPRCYDLTATEEVEAFTAVSSTCATWLAAWQHL